MDYGDGPFLDELCKAFDLNPHPRLIRSNTNLIYDCGQSMLRLTPNSYRSRDEVVRELCWLQFVGTHMDDVVRVRGDNATTTNQFVFAEESFTAARFETIDGKPIEEHQWGNCHFENLGKLTGSLHRIGQAYSPPSHEDLCEWDGTPEASLAQYLPDDDRKLRQLNETVSAYVASMPRVAESYGPIHYDIHSGNYLMSTDGRMILLDFENSCRGHFINDIAVVLYYARSHQFSGNDDGFHQTFLASFWKGYEKENVIPESEIHSIPWLLLYRALIVYSYLMKIWPDELNSDQRLYLERIEQSVENARVELGI